MHASIGSVPPGLILHTWQCRQLDKFLDHVSCAIVKGEIMKSSCVGQDGQHMHIQTSSTRSGIVSEEGWKE